MELLLDYQPRPRNSNIPIEQIVTTLHDPEKAKKTYFSKNHIYQNIPKEQPKEKIWTILFLLESRKSKK